MSENRGPRGPYSTGIARRRQIVDEALRTFGAAGYNGGSLRQIAHRVGITPAAINRHFASKDDLLNAVLKRWDEQVQTFQDLSAEGLDHMRQFRAAMEYHEQNRGLLAFFLTVAAESTAEGHPARPFVRSRYDWILSQMSRNLTLARDRGEVRSLDDEEIAQESRAFVAFVDGIELQYLLNPSFGLVEAFDHHWQSCLARWSATTPTNTSSTQ